MRAIPRKDLPWIIGRGKFDLRVQRIIRLIWSRDSMEGANSGPRSRNKAPAPIGYVTKVDHGEAGYCANYVPWRAFVVHAAKHRTIEATELKPTSETADPTGGLFRIQAFALAAVWANRGMKEGGQDAQETKEAS